MVRIQHLTEDEARTLDGKLAAYRLAQVNRKVLKAQRRDHGATVAGRVQAEAEYDAERAVDLLARQIAGTLLKADDRSRAK